MNHYDLLEHSDWKAESVLIVSPYVEKKFFENIVQTLKPRIMTVVIDDGCRAGDVSMIQDLQTTRTKIRVVLGSAIGLVHAKIFHIEWTTTGRTLAHTLVYGSGNATRQGFDGTTNAEVMCKVRLTASGHGKILEWIKKIKDAAASCSTTESCIEIDACRDFKLATGILIRLPGMKIRNAKNKASNFDLWLQRGHLMSTFSPDPNFLRISLILRAVLPAGDMQQKIEGIGFEIPKTRKLMIPYVDAKVEEFDKKDAPKWRGQYFIWTQLGDWCSDACFLKHSKHFKKHGHKERSDNLKQLEQLKNPNSCDVARSRFLDRVEKLWSTLGDQADKYLESKSGLPDREHYREIFEERLKRDFELLEDTEFKERYVKGCEVIDVPRFRMDTTAWNSFVESFVRQLHIEYAKTSSKSLIFKILHEALEDFRDHFDDVKKLEKLLRSKWNEPSHGNVKRSIGECADTYHDS